MNNCSDILKFIQFVDDITTLFSHTSIIELNKTLETESKKVTDWLVANKLIINLNKTHCMLFTNKIGTFNLSLIIDNINIEEKDSTSFLGVIIDNKLTWKHHIQHISNKISKTVALLKLLRHKFPKYILKLIYMSLIYSHLNYCNLIWGNAYNNALDPLYRLQKKAIRLVNNSHYLSPSEPIFKSLVLLDIHNLFKFNCLSFAYKCIKMDLYPQFKEIFIRNSSIHNYETRINNEYRPSLERLNLCQRSCLYQCIILWNLVGDDTKKYNSIITFKKKIKMLLIEAML